MGRDRIFGGARIRFTGLVVAVACLAAFAGCGGDDGGTQGGGEGGAANIVARSGSGNLTVALAAVNVTLSPVYLAESLGYYKKAGVSVKILSNLGANVTNTVVSGQADLGVVGNAAPLIAASQGKPTTQVYVCCAAGSAGMMVSRKEIKTFDQLDGKRIGTIGIGSAGYGLASIYKKKLNIDADIVPYPDVPSVTAALASGQVQAGVLGYDAFAALLASGDYNILIDTRTKEGQDVGGERGLAEGFYWGMSDRLPKIRPSVESWLSAINAAADWVKSHTPEEVLAELSKIDEYKAIAREVLLDQIKSNSWGIAPNGGHLPASKWPAQLDYVSAGGGPVEFNSGDPKFSYAERVDMSYLENVSKSGSTNP